MASAAAFLLFPRVPRKILGGKASVRIFASAAENARDDRLREINSARGYRQSESERGRKKESLMKAFVN